MSSYFWLLTVVIALTASHPAPADATGNRLDGIRTFLEQGNYTLAISTAHALLSRPSLPEHERYALLHILAQSEEGLAKIRQYTDVQAAIQAFEDLHKEFPKKFGPEKLQWKIAWLSWNKGDLERADTAAQAILQHHMQKPEAKRAALLHTRYLIKKKNYSAARSTLLRYFGIDADISMREETEGFVWLAVIDEAEKRTSQAYKTMQKAYASYPQAVEANPLTYAVYIRLLAQYSNQKTLLLHIKRFLQRYISSSEAPDIRLLQADTLAKHGHIQEAKTTYGILADRYKDTSTGKKAFMRQLMLDHRESKDEAALNDAVKKLSMMAAENQLSEIEAEARLYQAQLLQQLGKMDPTYLDRALSFYALAAASEHSKCVAVAHKEGATLLTRRLHDLLKREEWFRTVVLWKRYPQLRPPETEKLAFDIAQAYFHLMDLAHAEEILNRLYKQSQDSVWSQRVMLEIMRLWAERGDTNAIKKIMRWLTSHEHTLYRQEMLLIVADIQSRQGDASSARQTLASIAPEDLMPELRPTYWHTQANINQKLHHWHAAASAWQYLAGLNKGNKKWDYTYAQAHATLQSKDYLKAERILMQIPESARNDAWHYTLAMCALKTGRWKKAEEHLIPLSKGSPADSYTMRARLLLAEKHAEQLEREQQ